MQTVSETSGIAYEPASGAWDEAWEDADAVRPHYSHLVDALRDVELDDLVQRVEHDLSSRGASFRGADGVAAFRVDPIPRLIDAAEWAQIERGIVQRVRALNAFLADVYDEQRIVHAGVVPQHVIDG